MFRGVEQNDLELVEYYIRQGIDINFQHPEYFTGALFESIRRGYPEMTKLLLEHGAALNQTEMLTGIKPENLAKEKGHTQIIALLEQYRMG